MSAFASWCLDDVIPVLNGSAEWPVTDLLLVNYAANDFELQENIITDDAHSSSSAVSLNMERLTRRVLRHTDRAALMFVYFTQRNGSLFSNTEAEHEAVAQRTACRPSASASRWSAYATRRCGCACWAR